MIWRVAGVLLLVANLLVQNQLLTDTLAVVVQHVSDMCHKKAEKIDVTYLFKVGL